MFFFFFFIFKQELAAFRQRFRAELLDACRLATVLVPRLAFDCANHWLTTILESTLSSATAEWEAVAQFVDCVTARVQTHDNKLGDYLSTLFIQLMNDFIFNI